MSHDWGNYPGDEYKYQQPGKVESSSTSGKKYTPPPPPPNVVEVPKEENKKDGQLFCPICGKQNVQSIVGYCCLNCSCVFYIQEPSLD